MGKPLNIERVSWDELGPEFIANWGMPDGKFMPEHLALLGPTGSGKSFFMTHVLKERATARESHIVILATKPADGTLTKMNWPIINKWPPKYDQPQVIYWPKAPGLDKENLLKQREGITKMLNELWRPNANIVLAFDEISYVEDDLQIKTPIVRYWREARALGITMVAGTQRPRFVSRYMWSESTYTIAFRPKDEEDALQVGTVLGNRRFFKDFLMDELEKNEFIIRHRDSRDIFISKIEGTSSTSSTKDRQPETR